MNLLKNVMFVSVMTFGVAAAAAEDIKVDQKTTEALKEVVQSGIFSKVTTFISEHKTAFVVAGVLTAAAVVAAYAIAEETSEEII